MMHVAIRKSAHVEIGERHGGLEARCAAACEQVVTDTRPLRQHDTSDAITVDCLGQDAAGPI